MSSTPNNAAGNAADTTAPGAGSTGGQPDYKALYEQSQAEIGRLTGEVSRLTADVTEWKTRHGGLQGKYQQEQEKWKADSAKLSQFEQQIQALIGDKEALTVQLNTLTQEKGTLSSDLEKAKGRIGRFELLATEFPALLPFEAKGLLPEGQGDELKAKLTDFAAQLKALGAEALANYKAGGTPPPPAEPPENSSKALFALAKQAYREGKLEEYDKLYSKAVELQRQGK